MNCPCPAEQGEVPGALTGVGRGEGCQRQGKQAQQEGQGRQQKVPGPGGPRALDKLWPF